MDAISTFRMNGWHPPDRNSLRLTRLNIYSGLYIEFDSCRVLIDPSKIPLDVVMSLQPDLILVSHESMDHFDVGSVLRFLTRPNVHLIGSWGVMLALADVLDQSDTRWRQVMVGVPDTIFKFGDLHVSIKASRHCEYAVPLFFDLRNARTGFRILDLIDTDITDSMRAGLIETGPDVLVVPAGIALGANPRKAWEMVRLLNPNSVFASHFTHEGAEFITLAPAQYQGDRLMVHSWHEGVTLTGPRGPLFESSPAVEWNADCGAAAIREKRVPSAWMIAPPSVDNALAELARATDPEHFTTTLYFAALAARLSPGRTPARQCLLDVKVKDKALKDGPESVAAAYFLALGIALGVAEDATPADLEPVMDQLDPKSPYLSYWVLECCGRAGRHPALRQTVIDFVERIEANPDAWNQVGIRRKLMWEIDRLATCGARWPRLLHILKRGTDDSNPDVRLLAFKILPLLRPDTDESASLLRLGLDDPHEDVIEWAVRAHIDLFDTIGALQRDGLRSTLPRLLTHGTYQVRDRASVLAELLAVG